MIIFRAASPSRYRIAALSVFAASVIAAWTLAVGGLAGFGIAPGSGVLAACIAWFGLNARSRALQIVGSFLAASAGALAFVGVWALRPPAGASLAEWAALALVSIALGLTHARIRHAGELRQFVVLIGVALPIFILTALVYDAAAIAVLVGFKGSSGLMAVALLLLLTAIGLDHPADSLRWRMACGGMVGLAPLGALLLHFANAERETALANAARQLEASASFIAEEQDVVIGQTRLTLDVLKESPDFGRPGLACSAAISKFPFVVASLKTIYAVRRDGSVVCASLPDLLKLNLAHRPYIAEAFARSEPTVSGFFISGLRKQPRVALTVPIPGKADLILAASLDLSSLEPPLDRTLPAGATATLIDKNGVALVRRPAAAADLTGVDLRSREFVSHGLTQHVKPYFALELDGTVSLFVSRPVLFGEGALVVGLPKSQIVGPVDQRLNDRLALIAAILAGSFALCLIGAEIVVLRPIRRLIGYARELETGGPSCPPRVGSAGEVRELGRALAVAAAAIDDRERRLADAAVLFRQLFENSPGPKSIMRVIDDQDFVFETFNDAAERLSGISGADIIGKRPRDCLPDGLGERMERDLRRSLVHAEPLTFEREVFETGKNITVEIVQMPLFSPDGTVDRIFVSSRDISERKRVERLKTEFVSTVSHELRTPLTSIAGSLGLLANGVAGPIGDKAKGLIDIAHSNTLRLVRLVNEMLDIEKIEAGRMSFELRTLSMADVIEQAIVSLRGFAEGFSVTVAFDAAQRDLMVWGDADRLVQVVTNLLSNAVKFSPARETVLITLRAEGEIVIVAIRDHGPGVPYVFRPRLFEKFAQADESYGRRNGGTGLGLAIAKDIVERHAGALSYREPSGAGAEFEMRLPRHASSVAPARLVSRRRTVLVCQDDLMVATILAEQMRTAGFEPRTAGSMKEALEIAAQHEIEAVLLDLRMRDGDGFTLISTLRANAPDTKMPIVVVSADACLRKTDRRATSLGVAAWLEKPVDIGQLAELLNSMLGEADARS